MWIKSQFNHSIYFLLFPYLLPLHWSFFLGRDRDRITYWRILERKLGQAVWEIQITVLLCICFCVCFFGILISRIFSRKCPNVTAQKQDLPCCLFLCSFSCSFWCTRVHHFQWHLTHLPSHFVSRIIKAQIY